MHRDDPFDRQNRQKTDENARAMLGRFLPFQLLGILIFLAACHGEKVWFLDKYDIILFGSALSVFAGPGVLVSLMFLVLCGAAWTLEKLPPCKAFFYK